MAEQTGSVPLEAVDEEDALRLIAEGTAATTGQAFFRALVNSVAKALGTEGAWVTEYFPEERKLVALAFWLQDGWVEGYETLIDHTPCEVVVREKRLVHYPDRVFEVFPDDPDARAPGTSHIVSYMGMPLLDAQDNIMGHLAVIDGRPIPEQPRIHSIFKIFAARAAAELERMYAERAVHEREERLGRLISGAMDAIVELDGSLRVSQFNPAAEKVFGLGDEVARGRSFAEFLRGDSADDMRKLIVELDKRAIGDRFLWVPGGVEMQTADGTPFVAEGTLSRSDTSGAPYYTLILRNVNDRLEAERTIEALTRETQYLKEELRDARNVFGILGESPALKSVLEDVREVAETDATVLLLGETGTGKDLVARAIHEASDRHDRPLITVNCAAIPTTLMESEFFGHEKGAFTGATEKREGRFALADRGTIFLDEIGELSLELQAKLLRVLQQGEFEPVGGAQTRKVDVRVIAATNRDLKERVQAGAFREDLFYRLNVFPISVPPLRERGDDIVLLAEAFVERYAKKMGKELGGFTDACIAKLRAYSWPGNVRELENVVERAVITARNGRPNLDRALPEVAPCDVESEPSAPGGVMTAAQFHELERRNILRALESTDWKVSGKKGAAALLGMKPSTLSSRMKALDIHRPD